MALHEIGDRQSEISNLRFIGRKILTLIVKVPERGATFVLLGNSEALSRKFDLGRDNDVTRSPFAREFLKTIGL
jgi:hypothetical protein